MVSGKNVMASNYQIAVNAKKSNVSKPSKAQKSDDDFRSMMDKKAQNNTTKPQKSEDAKEDAAVSQNEEVVSAQKEEKAPEDGMIVQVMAQCIVLPEQERAALNWGKAVPEEASMAGIQEAAVKIVSEETPVSVNVLQENVTELPKEATHVQANVSTKADVPKEVQTNTSVKTEDTAKQVEHGEQKKVETVQTGKETLVHTDKKVMNEDVLAGKEMVWQKEAVQEEAIPKEVVPKTKTEENLLKFKVGETVDLSSKQATNDLADKILMRSIGKENNAFEIQLKPQELGSIKIKLVFEHGKVNVAMFCENQKAAEILSASSAKLSEIIENRTGDHTSVFVEQKEENPFHDNDQKENDHQHAQEQKKENHDDKKDGELLDFVQQMRLGLAGIQSTI